MKILLTFLAASLFSLAAFAQTSSEPATEGSDTQVMGAQEEIYGGEDTTTTTPQAEEDVSEPGLQGSEDSSIQEEVDSGATEDTMRSDTMEGSETLEGSDSTSPGTSTP